MSYFNVFPKLLYLHEGSCCENRIPKSIGLELIFSQIGDTISIALLPRIFSIFFL